MVSYLVLHYRNADVTEQCIKSILQVREAHSPIVIVDNGSNNGSYEALLKQFQNFEAVHFLKNEQNLGYAAGNNVGFRFAKETLQTDWIVLLNNDVILEQQDFQSTMLQSYEESPFFVAGPDITTPEGGSQNPFRMEPPEIKHIKKALMHDRIVLFLMRIRLQKILKKVLGYDKQIFQHNEVQTIKDFRGVLHGSCLIFSPDYVKRYNGLYGGTFLYCEEEILCYILQKSQNTYSYIHELQVVHKHSVSMKREIKDEDRRKMLEVSRRIDSYRKFLQIANDKEDISKYLI